MSSTKRNGFYQKKWYELNELKPGWEFISVQNLTLVFSQLFTCARMNWETQYGMDFISVILTEMKFQTSKRFSCEQNIPKTKWISEDSLDIDSNVRVRLKLIAGIDIISVILTEMQFHSSDKLSCKQYPKWNTYTCPSKYQVVLKCSRTEKSCEQNLFSYRFEISYLFEFIWSLMWKFS